MLFLHYLKATGEVLATSVDAAAFLETDRFGVAIVPDDTTVAGRIYDARRQTLRVPTADEIAARETVKAADELARARREAVARFRGTDATCLITFGALAAVWEQMERVANGAKRMTREEFIDRVQAYVMTGE